MFPWRENRKNDNSYIDTALRETFEEIGINADDISIIGKMDILFGPRGVIVYPIVAHVKINSIEELIIDKSEVEKAFLVPLSYFENNKPEHF